MSIDVITLIPKQAQYLFWERMMQKNRGYFDNWFVVFTHDEVTGKFYHNWLQDRIGENATFLESPKTGKGDWRNIATNYALDRSKSESVLFMEPDFFLKDFSIIKSVPNIGVDINGRIHPCFLKLQRFDIELTDRDFTAYPDKGLDHFDLFTKQLLERGSAIATMLPDGGWFHMAGLTHNMRLEARGEQPNYKPDEYRLYKVLESLL